ncbi:DUF6993 domain-containing protein [Leifsonia sp. NPDC058230]|uniref:DUF6993 domain-containing protein n=1 Tax=Leifsonia sp. NPDC058230 TaxID=3346391 RepID=UPI0036D95775
MAVGISLAVGLALSGCVGGTTGGTSSHSASAAPAPSATSSAPAVVELHPQGSAQDNLPFFDQVNRATLAAHPNAVGRDFIDALVAAGFDKSSMQLTVDTTTIGLKANSIQFSVRMGDTCLIGQNGADAGGYNSQVTAVLATGACLIGETRPIDW